MPNKNLIFLATVVISVIFACEYASDATHSYRQFPYSEFQSLLHNGTLDKRVKVVEFPESTNILGRRFVRLSLKGDDKFWYFMYVPPDFTKTDLPLLEKTKLDRYAGCSLGYNPVLKYCVEMILIGISLFCFKSEFFEKSGS